MSSKKKICLLIPSLHVGGMERVMSELAHYYSNKIDLEVHLVMYGKQPQIFYAIPGSVIIYKPQSSFKNSARLYSTLKRLFFLRKTIKKIGPNTILSFGEYWNSFVLLALLWLPYPVYVSDRCQPDKKLGKPHDFIRRWLYPKAAGIIVQTEKARNIYKKAISHPNIHVIGNPLRNIIFNQSVEKENMVLSVGRLIQSKHHDLLIKIFVNLNCQGWKLVIAGDDALKQQNKTKLTKLISELSAEDKVILAGNQGMIDVLYQKAKVFAFTSSSEGFPNVIGEALSGGLPVVSYDCVAGPSEMITHGENGFLVPMFDDALFQEKLKLLIDNEALREQMAQKARKSIKKFSIETIGEQYLDFILTRS